MCVKVGARVSVSPTLGSGSWVWQLDGKVGEVTTLGAFIDDTVEALIETTEDRELAELVALRMTNLSLEIGANIPVRWDTPTNGVKVSVLRCDCLKPA